MTRQIGSIASVVFSVLLVGFGGAILPDTSASATDDCIAAPKSPPPQGSHWYYRTDREKQRRCWYLAPQGLHVHKVAPQAAPRVHMVVESPALPSNDDRTSVELTPVEQPAAQTSPASTPGDVSEKFGTNAWQGHDPQNPPAIVEHAGTMLSVSTVQVSPETGTQDTDARNDVEAESLLVATIQRTGPALFIAGVLIAAFVLRVAFTFAGSRRRQIFVNRHGAGRRSTAAPRFASTIFDVEEVPPLSPIDCIEASIDSKELLWKLCESLEGRAHRQDRALSAQQASLGHRNARPWAGQAGRGRGGQQDGAGRLGGAGKGPNLLGTDTLTQQIAPAA